MFWPFKTRSPEIKAVLGMLDVIVHQHGDPAGVVTAARKAALNEQAALERRIADGRDPADLAWKLVESIGFNMIERGCFYDFDYRESLNGQGRAVACLVRAAMKSRVAAGFLDPGEAEAGLDILSTWE